jgi:fibronectin-binding autotransporter adhesin
MHFHVKKNMNRTFRLIWSKTLNMLVAASECATSMGKSAGGETAGSKISKIKTMPSALAATVSVLGLTISSIAFAQALPSGAVFAITGGNTSNAYQNYSFSYTPSVSGSENLLFAFRQDPAYWTFGNVSLSAAGATTNLLTDPLFTSGTTLNYGAGQQVTVPTGWGFAYQLANRGSGDWDTTSIPGFTGGSWNDGIVGAYDAIYQSVYLTAGVSYLGGFTAMSNTVANGTSVGLGVYLNSGFSGFTPAITASNINAPNMAAAGLVNANTLYPIFDGGGLLLDGTILGSNYAFSITGHNGTINTNGLTATISTPIVDAQAGTPGGLTIVDSTGTGALILTAANTYTGATNVNGGTLTLAAAGSLASTAVAVAAGAVLNDTNGGLNNATSLTNNGTLSLGASQTIAQLSGAGTGVVALDVNTLNITNGGAFAGVIGGSGSLVLAGGNLALSGANTYTGGTRINAGSLQIGNGGTTGAILGNVLDNGTLAVNHVDAVSLPGTISGSGSFAQLGAGTTTLGNANTYAGGTTIAAGTLVGSTSSFGSGAITDNAALVINQPTSAVFANPINGTGTFVKTGAGQLNLTGVGSLSGPTTVAAGTLSVNGSIANSAVTVDNGAVLGGNGTVGSVAVLSGGTIAPGNSIGTLTVHGNYVQAAGSTYQVEVNAGSNASDRIVASGSATIGSGALLNVTQNPAGLYTLGTKYTVLTTGSGVTGRYTLTGTTRTAFVQLADTYDANNVYLTAQKVRSFAAAGQTVNQFVTGLALDSLPASSSLANALAWLPGDTAAQSALHQLSGEIHASVKTAMLEDSRFVREAANNRLLGALCAPGTNTTAKTDGKTAVPSDCAQGDGVTAWGRIFGAKGRLSGDGNSASLDSSTSGAFVGADTAVAGGWRVGGLIGYGHSTYDASAAGSSATSDDYHAGVYGGNHWDNTSLRLGTSYTWSKLNTQRSVFFPGLVNNLHAKSDASTAQVFGEVGQRMDVDGVALEPFAALAYVRARTSGFNESVGLSALTANAGNSDVTFGTLGVRASAELDDSTRVRALVGWRHGFGGMAVTNTQALAGSTAFTVYGVPLARDVGVLEAGIETQLQTNLTLEVQYSGQFGARVRENGVRANVAWKF